MSEANKKMEEFKKLWDKGLAISQANPNVRDKFNHLCALNPQRAKQLMEHPHVQLAKKELEKAIENREKQELNQNRPSNM